MKKTRIILIFVLGILFGVVGMLTFQGQGQNLMFNSQMNLVSLKSFVLGLGKSSDANYTRYHRFEEIYGILNKEYFDKEKLNSGQMLEKSVKAFVDGVDDPYTVYMDAKQNSGFEESLKGNMDFEGIGAVVSKKDYYVLIEELLKDSPGFKAGLLPLDRIIMVGTSSVKDLDINQAVDMIKGPKGTQADLFIERVKKDDTKELIEKKVTREKLNIPSVTTKILTGISGFPIGYINISVIGEETDTILTQEIGILKSKGISGVILDLRGNGGGFLPVAVDIASHFIPVGKVVVSSKYRTIQDETYTSKGFGELQGLPVIVLIDGITASAGEIIAMALQEQIGAKLVGEKTFGKGSIQTIMNFDDGTSMKYTIGKRYDPNGKNIDKQGVGPDIEIKFDTEKYIKQGIDTQLEKAKEVIGYQLNF